MSKFSAAAACIAISLGFVCPTQSQSQGTQEVQFVELLLSSAWCSYKFSAISGTESMTGFRFRRDGTWFSGSNSEQLARNPEGRMYRRDGNQSAGRWAVRAGDLYMGEGNGPLSPVGVSVRYNSNGSPIIVVSADEYMMC